MAVDDELYMRQALALAAQGLGRTSPNPAVGAVVVSGGEVVGTGFHRAAGQPHAEVEALAAAGERAREATVYVTLEPCSHYGRTPPCTEALQQAGVTRVVYACEDCDSRCAGKAAPFLRSAGIEVEAGLLAAEARRLNEAFFQHKQTGRPLVTLKLALTLEGRMATRTGDSQWITSEASRHRVQLLRDQSDAVMVGAGTVARDDPRLTVRLSPEEQRDTRQPLAVLLCPDGVPTGARVLRGGRPVLVFSAPGAAAAAPLDAPEVVEVPGAEGRLDLPAVLHELGRRNVMSVLLEGGPTLAGSFLREGLVDKLIVFYAPKLLLDAAAPGPMAPGREVLAMAQALCFEIDAAERIGPDLMVTLYPCSRD